MPLQRVTFVIIRKPSVSPDLLMDLICDPALELDLHGRVIHEGGGRHVVMLEGERRRIDDYKTYIWVGRPVMGRVSHFTDYTPTARIFKDGIELSFAPPRGGRMELPDSDDE